MTSIIPESILIIGAGVFGLSTAHSLSLDPDYINTKITLLDRTTFPAYDNASTDSSRLIRADYPDPAYSKLAAEAQQQWRGEFGAQGRYRETGLFLSVSAEHKPDLDKSFENVQAFYEAQPNAKAIERLPTTESISNRNVTGGSIGCEGYHNPNAGTADPEASMRYVYHQIISLGRVQFRDAVVRRLLINHDGDRVDGAILDTGETTQASLTIVAAGAWSSALIDLRGIVRATAQVVCYTSLTRSEQAGLASMPVQFDYSGGMLLLPPPPVDVPAPTPAAKASGTSCPHNYLKIVRNGHGYLNMVEIPHPELPGDDDREKITVALPHKRPYDFQENGELIPREGTRACHAALKSWFDMSSPIPDRPFWLTRIGYYSDTPTGDWLVTYHPRYNGSLFVATGDSGHAFKFLPVLGDVIIKCLENQCPDAFREKWAWPERRLADNDWPSEGGRGGPREVMLCDLALSEEPGRLYDSRAKL